MNGFTEQELEIQFRIKDRKGRVDTPVFSAPVTPAENMRRTVFEKNPAYFPDYKHLRLFNPRVYPDSEARGLVTDGGEAVQKHPEGFQDAFHVKWVYVEQANGAMVQPGHPVLTDLNEWQKKIQFPEPEKWDWEMQKKISSEYLKDHRLAVSAVIYSGFFERMISLMDFEDAAIALIDEDQEDAVHAFLDRTADVYCSLIDKLTEQLGIDAVTIHDDWGSQRAPFFSLSTAQNMLVPHIRKVTDYAHKKGILYDMHCCGQVEDLLPAMIEAGVDVWTGQENNDKRKLFHKHGKEILIGVETPEISHKTTDREMKETAELFAEEFIQPGAVAMIGFGSPIYQEHFHEYLYEFARKKLAK